MLDPVMFVTELVLAVAAIAYFARASMKNGRPHPGLSIALASTTLFWTESVNAYLMYAVYNPALTTFPDDLPVLGMAHGGVPIGTPLGFIAYLLVVATICEAIARRLVRRYGWNRIRTLLAVGWGVGIGLDLCVQVLGTLVGLFKYERAATALVLFPGTTDQYPLYMSVGMATVNMFVTYLFGRTDEGRSLLEPRERGSRTWRPSGVGLLRTAVALHVVFLAATMLPASLLRATDANTVTTDERFFADLPNQPK